MSPAEQLRIGDAAAETEPPGSDAERSPRRDEYPPTPEQAAAIATRDRDVFLAAGAGTGKTRVLVQRYCDAVTEDDAGVESILAFTFTEKAAGELRARIRHELAARASAEDDAERSRQLWRLARDTERAWIGTIHGFCRRLLAAHPVAAGLDPHFRVLAEAEAELVAEQAFDAALDEVASGDGEGEAIAAGYNVWRLRKLIAGAYEQLRSHGTEAPELPPMPEPRLSAVTKNGSADHEGDDADDVAELSPAEIAYATESYEALRELMSAYGRHYERLKAERSGLDFEDLQIRAVRLLRDEPRIARRYPEQFEHLMVDEFQDTNRLQLDLIRELQGPDTRLFVVGDEFQSIYGFRNADLEVFRSERARATAAPDERVQVLPLRGNFRSRPEIIAAVNALGGLLLEDFEPLTPSRGSTADAADGAAPPAVQLLLTECDGWDAEDIDLHPLSGEETPPYKVAEARHLARRLRELADAGVERRGMVVLLRAFTHIATYEEALERAGLAPYVIGGRGYWSHQQVEDMLRLLSCVANPLDDEMLFGALATPAVGASPDALWMLRRAASRGGRARHVWPVVERHFGDAPAREEEGSPGEDESAEEKRERIDAESWIERIDAGDADRLRTFCARLARLRAIAPLLSLEALTDRTARELGYDLAVLMRDRGTRRYANVRKLMRMARQFEAAEGRDLGAFLRFAEARTARGQREALAATEAEDHDGVRLMTIHAAKGLEFETVAVADLSRPLLSGSGWTDIRLAAPGDPGDEEAGDEPARRHPSLGIQLARAGEKPLTLWDFERLKLETSTADAAEELRLTYVAMTRARDHLLLSGSFTDSDLERGDALSRSVLRRLLPELGFSGGETELERDDMILPVLLNRAGPEAAADLVRRASSAPRPAPGVVAGSSPPLLPPVADVPAAGHLSYAALADYERCGYRFYAERVLGLASLEPGSEEPAPLESDEVLAEADLAQAAPGDGIPKPGVRERRLAFGNAVHGLLEWSARNRWATPARERCEALLRQEGLGAEAGEVDRALHLVGGWLGSELCASLRSARVRLRPEAPFLLAIGEGVVRGKMDLVAQLADGETLVIDYKTDALDGADPMSHAERYATQRGLYALAASRLDADHRGVRTAYCFLEAPEQPVEHTYDAAALDAAHGEVERLISGVQAAEFEVTGTPHAALCHDCPARRRLCSYDEEQTRRRLDP
jgi:ATP-dependent exoDNAse (exonuclease V) beta subunit